MNAAVLPGSIVAPKPRKRASAKAKQSASQALPLKRSGPKTRKRSIPVDSAEPHIRTSEILRKMLTEHKGEMFTVKNIIDSLGGTSAFGTSLMVFSLPEVLPIPIPGISAVVVIPVAVISTQMMAGSELRLPNYILKRSIHRKALAGAIHTILPVIERAEKVVKPRWDWILHPLSKRMIGAIIFILALGIALPIPGTNIPLATSIFIIAMGMAERDGQVVLLGILLGLASLVLLGGILTAFLALFGLV